MGSFDAKIKLKKNQNKKLLNEAVDITLPSNRSGAGKAHPIHLAEEELVRICESMGFSVTSGPIIEDEFHNFEALNIRITSIARYARYILFNR